MAISVGPKGSIAVSAPVKVPEKRRGERTVAVDVLSVFGALEPAGRAFFRAAVQPAGDREVMFRFREPKAVNLRPAALYEWRVEVEVDQDAVKPLAAKGQLAGEYIGQGQVIPGSRPQETAERATRVFRGRFPMLVRDYIIQIREDGPDLQQKVSTAENASTT